MKTAVTNFVMTFRGSLNSNGSDFYFGILAKLTQATSLYSHAAAYCTAVSKQITSEIIAVDVLVA